MHKTLAVFGIVFLLGGMAFAQKPGQRMAVDIPFDFVAGGRIMPAGHYTFLVHEMPSYPSGTVLVGRNRERATTGFLFTRVQGGPFETADPHITFDRVGAMHFLHQIHFGGERARGIRQRNLQKALPR